MVFGYDKEHGFGKSISDFFKVPKETIVRELNDVEKSFFEHLERDSNSNVARSKENILDDLLGEDQNLVKDLTGFVENNPLENLTADNYINSIAQATEGTSQFKSALSAVGAVGKTVLKTIGNMALSAVAAFAIGKIIDGIDYLWHYNENIIKAGQEAKDSIDNTVKSLQDSKQSLMDLGSSFGDQTDQIKTTGDAINQVAEKYTELRQGVSNDGQNENVSLSTDEYQQYIDLSNQLAEQFPQLVAGYDSQGNAVLNLGKNADSAAASIRGLYEAQVASAHVDMGKNLQSAYDGIITQIGQIEDENTVLKDQMDAVDLQQNGELQNDVLSQLDSQFIKIDSRKYGSLSGDYFNELTDKLTELGIQWESMPFNTELDTETGEWYQDFGISIAATSEQLSELKEDLKDVGGQTAETFSSAAKQYSANELLIRDQWKSLSQTFGEFLQTSDAFTGLDQELQNAFLASIGDLNLDALQTDYDGKVLPFLYERFIQPMADMKPEAQKTIADLLKVDPSELTLDEYKSQVDKAFKDAFGNDTEEQKEAQEQFKNAYGLDSSIEEMEDNASRLKEAYKDFPYASDFIDRMKTGDLSIAAQLIDSSSVNIEKGTDGLSSAIEKYKKTIANTGNDTTLASVLADEDNEVSTSIDSLQSDLSSLSTALQSLKTGDFKDSDLTDLIQQFPQLASGTDDLQKSISNLKVSKITDIMKKIDDVMVGASKEEMEYAKTLKGSILKEADLSDVEPSAVKQEIEKLFKNAYSSAPENAAEKMAKGFIASYSSYMTSNVGAQAMLKAVEQNIGNITSTGYDWESEIKSFLPTISDFINNETIQSQLTNYQDKYQALYQAQKDVKKGLMTGSTRKTFLDKFPDLAKYAGNTEKLSSAIDDLMDSMDSNVTDQFTDAIQALRDAGDNTNADALQKYVQDVIAGAHDIEGAYKEIANLKIKTPQLEAAKDASSTENGGATYEDMLSMYNTAKEAYNKGLVGTDDFKTVAAMFSPTGSDDYANFAENMSKIERYFTDGSDGCINFLKDLQTLGLAEQENGNWTYSLGNSMEELQETANRLGIGFEPLMSVFGRLEDYGFYNDFFTTEEAGTEKISDLYSKLAAEKMRLAQIKANPDTEDYATAISESEKKIAGFEERIKYAEENMQELSDKGSKYYKERAEYAKSVAQSMIDEINSTDDINLKEQLQNQLDAFAKEYHLVIKADAVFSLEEQAEVISPDIKIDLSATGEDLDNQISELTQYISDLQGDADIDVNTDKISAAQDILSYLITQKQELEAPAVMNISTDQLDGVDEKLKNAVQAIQDYQTAINNLEKQKSLGLDTSEAQAAVDSAKKELDSIDDETSKTLNFDIKGLDDNEIKQAIADLNLDAFDDGIQQLTYHFNLDNEADANEFLDKIAGLPKDTQKITISVNLDGVSRQSLELINSTINNLQASNPSMSISVDTKNVQAQVSGAVTAALGGLKGAGNGNAQATVSVGINDRVLKSGISDDNKQLNSLNSKTVTPTVGINDQATSILSQITSEIKALPSQKSIDIIVNRTNNISNNVTTTKRAAGNASANGTPIIKSARFNDGYLGTAYAQGIWGEPNNTKALTGELGQELVVRGNRFFTVGDNGPEIVDLKKNDIVFNHLQTRDILTKGHTIGRGRALASGNARAVASPGGGGGTIGGFGLKKGSTSTSSTSSIKANTAATNKNTTATDDNTEKIKKSSKVWDWVERNLTYWSNKVKAISDKITDYVSSAMKTSLLKKQINTMYSQIQANTNGHVAYMQKANAVAQSYSYYNSDGDEIKVSIPEIYQQLVQRGEYNIEDMDTSTDQNKALAEAIEQYKTWYDKAQDCQQAIVELRNEQQELFEQWVNMPTEKAEKKIEGLTAGYNGLTAVSSRVTAAQSGGSTQAALAKTMKDDLAKVKAARDADRKVLTDAQNANKKATTAKTKADKTVKSTASALKKTKLTATEKAQVNAGQKIDTSNLTGSKKKRAVAYNKALDAQAKAAKKVTSTKASVTAAKKPYADSNAIYQSMNTNVKNALKNYNSKDELSYMNSIVDQEVALKKQEKNARKTAVEEANKNLIAINKQKANSDKRLAEVQKYYGNDFRLTEDQKKVMKSGKEISLDGVIDIDQIRIINEYNNALANAVKEKQDVTTATNALKTAEENLASAEIEAAQATVDAVKTKFDNVKNYYDARLNYQKQITEINSKDSDLSQAHGDFEKSSDYTKKIKYTQREQAIADEQAKKLKEQLDAGVKSGVIKRGSDEWYDLATQLREAQNAAYDYNTQIEQLKQQQIGIYYAEQFERAAEKVDRFRDKLDGLKALISDDMKVDKNTGLLTESGALALTLDVDDIQASTENLKTYIKERQQIINDYKAGKFGEDEYNQKLKTVDDNIKNTTANINSSRSSMLDLIKTQAQAELDVLDKVIDKRKEALSAKKNYYDYDKTLKNKTKDIQILERQIAALNGSTNAEDKARRAQLQEQLSDAQDALKDTITDHAYSMQSDALDKLSTDLSEDMDEWINKISSNMEEMTNAINDAVKNAGLTTAGTINAISSILKHYGISDTEIAQSGLTDIKGYASGTDYVPKDGVYNVNENGMESVYSPKYGVLTFLNQGDKVYNADLTKSLLENAGLATKNNMPDFSGMVKTMEECMYNIQNMGGNTYISNFYVDGVDDIESLYKKLDAHLDQKIQANNKKIARDIRSLR